MPRVLYVLLLFVPGAVAARLLNLPDSVVFATSAAALIPLAGLIGVATDSLAHHLGPRFGGLLNATFGNAAELIITVFAVQRGLLTLVKASITGSIIGNTLFVLGLSLLVGGLRHGSLRFDAHHAGVSAAMMILAIAGLYLPAVFSATVPSQASVQQLSQLVAIVLLLLYVAYLIYTIQPGAADPAEAGGEFEADPRWTRRTALLVLGAATVGAAVSSEILVGAVDPVTHELGLSEFFVGVVIVALVGNVAEHFSAIQLAWSRRIDVSLSIAASSSTQIALFVAPLLVLASLALGHPMDLVFAPLELTILGLATALFAYISVDGESNWLEGMQLLGIYAIAAIAFLLIPVAEPR